MPIPVTFASTSPRMGLPLLFAGQSQKEVFVNEALALTDALLHCAIEGIANIPPTSTSDGTNWLIGNVPSGDWGNQAGKIACRQAGSWIFVQPVDGMHIFNRANGQFMLYAGGWKSAPAIPAPNGGAVVDLEARSAINQLIAALGTSGVLATS